MTKNPLPDGLEDALFLIETCTSLLIEMTGEPVFPDDKAMVDQYLERTAYLVGRLEEHVKALRLAMYGPEEDGGGDEALAA